MAVARIRVSAIRKEIIQMVNYLIAKHQLSLQAAVYLQKNNPKYWTKKYLHRQTHKVLDAVLSPGTHWVYTISLNFLCTAYWMRCTLSTDQMTEVWHTREEKRGCRHRGHRSWLSLKDVWSLCSDSVLVVQDNSACSLRITREGWLLLDTAICMSLGESIRYQGALAVRGKCRSVQSSTLLWQGPIALAVTYCSQHRFLPGL